MDWGLAKLTRSEPASGAGALMNAKGPVGTPDFMAPEQARGNPADVDARSDVFGVGALLFEVLSGYGPYGKENDHRKTLERACAGKVISIDRACEPYGIARRIRAVAERATQADPALRFQTVTELKDAMRAFLHGGMHLPRKTFAAGEIIVREGEKGDAAYMIVTGRCRAYRTVAGVEETLSVMDPGDVFGEMALILFEPRAASVVAMEEVTVVVLDQATMNEGLGLSGWTGALVRALAQRFNDLEQMVRSSGIRANR
jgi:serine/threonine-protein kinase